MVRLSVLAALDVVVAIAVRAAYGGGGVLSTAAGVVLGPVAVVAVYRFARRVGPTFAIGAAAMVFAGPLLGVLYMLSSYRSTYTHDALPALFGLSHPGWFALGVLVAAAVSFAPARALAAAGVAAAAVGVAVWGVHPLAGVQTSLHEAGWSVTFIEWLVIAGVLGLGLRARWPAAGIAGWLAIVVLRAAHRPFEHGAFWSALAPAVPAAALLLAAIGLLLPRRSPAARVAPDPR